MEAAADAELTLTAGRTRTLTAQEVYQTVKDAVVTVAVDLGGGKMSVGTGILFREDGYFVTNQHVVAGGSACTVLLADGTPYEANYIASDADYDVAVLKIDGTGFPTAVDVEILRRPFGIYLLLFLAFPCFCRKKVQKKSGG